MAWSQVEPTGPHLTYLVLSAFLIVYTLFATFIRNRLHLSEPPLALIFGIIIGPKGLGWLTPNLAAVVGPGHVNGDHVLSSPALGGWEWGDDVVS